MEYSKDLDDQFKKLGFDNYADFFKTAAPWDGLPIHAPPVPNTYVLDDLYSDPDELYFIFTIAQNEQNHWYLCQIMAGRQVESNRVREGVIVIDRLYELKNGPLPNKEQIRKEILDLVKIEAVKDRFYRPHLRDPISVFNIDVYSINKKRK